MFTGLCSSSKYFFMQKLIDCGCDSVAKWNKQVFQDKLVRTVLLMLVYVLGEYF